MATDYKGIASGTSTSTSYISSLVRQGISAERLGTAGQTYLKTQDLKQDKAAAESNYKTIKSKIDALDKFINSPGAALSTFVIPWEEADYITTGVKVPKRISFQEAVALRKKLNGELYSANRTLTTVNSSLKALNTRFTELYNQITTKTLGQSSGVIANAPMPKVAYFRQIQSLLGNKQDVALYAGNTPDSITDAAQQWTKAQGAGSKGMIQTWNPPTNFYSAVSAEGTDIAFGAGSQQRYGFKFLYNPETVSMSYGGVLGFDITTLTSGTTKTLPLAPNVFQSTISFNIPLNRIFDMSYLTSGGAFKSGVVANDVYPYTVDATERALIYSRGTMYDFEYLLKSILGIEIPTQFRGKTADIGFLYGRPVEIHLGTSLRYLVQISNISIDHLLFDARMVPIFSNVSMTVNRIPDYSGETIGGDGSPPARFRQTTTPGGGSLIGGRSIQ